MALLEEDVPDCSGRDQSADRCPAHRSREVPVRRPHRCTRATFWQGPLYQIRNHHGQLVVYLRMNGIVCHRRHRAAIGRSMHRELAGLRDFAVAACRSARVGREPCPRAQGHRIARVTRAAASPFPAGWGGSIPKRGAAAAARARERSARRRRTTPCTWLTGPRRGLHFWNPGEFSAALCGDYTVKATFKEARMRVPNTASTPVRHLHRRERHGHRPAELSLTFARRTRQLARVIVCAASAKLPSR